LGGSYNFQIADTLGRIPKHPAIEADLLAAKTAATQSADNAAGLKTPGPVGPVPLVVSSAPSGPVDQAPLTVDLTSPQPPFSETLAQRELATHSGYSGKAQALHVVSPLLARSEDLRLQREIRQVAEVPTPTVKVTPQSKFTEPRKISPEWILDVKDKPNVVKVYIQLIFAHLKNIRAYTLGDPFLVQFLNLVTDSQLM
jgi:hypothetical protein